MRSTPIALVILGLFLLCGHALSDPAPDWDSTVAAPGSYSCTSYGPSDGIGSSWVYGWDLTYLGWDLENNPSQHLRLFAVYEATEAHWIGGKDPDLELALWDEGINDFVAMPAGSWRVIEGPKKVAIEFVNPTPDPDPRSEPGNRYWFQATFTNQLTSPDKHAIHIIQMGMDAESSEWVNNTPELGTWALLLLGGVPVVLRQWRRRKQ